MTDPNGDPRGWTWTPCKRCGDPTARSAGWHRWCDPDRARRRPRPEGHADLFDGAHPPVGDLFDEGA